MRSSGQTRIVLMIAVADKPVAPRIMEQSSYRGSRCREAGCTSLLHLRRTLLNIRIDPLHRPLCTQNHVQGIAAMTNASIPQEVWDHEVTATAPQPVDWLWQGLVAQGNLILLTSQGKAGKTTLLSLLL